MDSLWEFHDRYKLLDESARKEIEAELTIQIRDFFQGANPFHHKFAEIIMDEYCNSGKQNFGGFEDSASSAASSPGTLMPMSSRSEAAAELEGLVADMDVPPLSLNDSDDSALRAADQEEITKIQSFGGLTPAYCMYCGDPSAPDVRISLCDHGYCLECYEQLVLNAEEAGVTAQCRECGKGPLALKPIATKTNVFKVAEAALLPLKLDSRSASHTQNFLSSPIWMPASPNAMDMSEQPSTFEPTVTTSSRTYIPELPFQPQTEISESETTLGPWSTNMLSALQAFQHHASATELRGPDQRVGWNPGQIKRTESQGVQKRGMDEMMKSSDFISSLTTSYNNASIAAKKQKLFHESDDEDFESSSISEVSRTDDAFRDDTSDDFPDGSDVFWDSKYADRFARRALASSPLPIIRDITSEESYSDDEEFESATNELDYGFANDDMLDSQEQDVMENMTWIGSDFAEDADEQASFGACMQMQAMSFALEGEADEDAAEALYGMY